jgi:hypothetical protein
VQPELIAPERFASERIEPEDLPARFVEILRVLVDNRVE